MSANAFINWPSPPADADLAAALGPAKAVWDELLAELARKLAVNDREWKCHSPKWGWSLRVKRKTRTIMWLSPSAGAFTALFILGEKALRAAREARLPARVVNALAAAPKYPEGTGVRLATKSPRDLAALMKLAAIKLAN